MRLLGLSKGKTVENICSVLTSPYCPHCKPKSQCHDSTNADRGRLTPGVTGSQNKKETSFFPCAIENFSVTHIKFLNVYLFVTHTVGLFWGEQIQKGENMQKPSENQPLCAVIIAISAFLLVLSLSTQGSLS